MSANSSNPSPLPQFNYYCLDSRVSLVIFSAFGITRIFLFIPLIILIVYLGYQRRRRSTATTSTPDFITYNMAAMELNSLVFFIFFFCGIHTGITLLAKIGFYVFNIIFPGEMLLHVLTCVERYLAVVHPIVYRGLRQSGRVRIRNISTGCVWLLCFGWIGIVAFYDPDFPMIPYLCVLASDLIVVSFCSLRVLCALIRPGPGKVGGDEERVSQFKLRAFHTVVAISAMLWVWLTGLLVTAALGELQVFSYSDGCAVLISGTWFTLPGSLVLPILFLHRAGKLQCCRHSMK